MPANANDLSRPRRKPIRLQDFDYAEPNAYFITICTCGRACLFGRIIEDAMHPNEFGRIASAMWERIPAHFPHMVLDERVVMPNHVHGVVHIVEPPPQRDSRRRGSIGAAVGSYKSAVSRRIGEISGKSRESVWQRGFCDRVIRDGAALDRIRRYIAENPARWSRDPENPHRNP